MKMIFVGVVVFAATMTLQEVVLVVGTEDVSRRRLMEQLDSLQDLLSQRLRLLARGSGTGAGSSTDPPRAPGQPPVGARSSRIDPNEAQGLVPPRGVQGAERSRALVHR